MGGGGGEGVSNFLELFLCLFFFWGGGVTCGVVRL